MEAHFAKGDIAQIDAADYYRRRYVDKNAGKLLFRVKEAEE